MSDKIWTVEEIRAKLATDSAWAKRGILVLYSYQTATEQEAGATAYHNGVGFSATDAPLLSSFAEQLQRNWDLSAKQLAWAHKKLPKYAKQLYRAQTGLRK